MNDKLQEAINALRAAGDEAGAKAVEELRAEFARTMEQYHTGQRASYESGRKDEAEERAAPLIAYSDRVRCKSCENGSGPEGCTDCLNTGHDPMAFAGGIDAALNDAYAEGRKDEAETLSQAARDVLNERQRQISAEGWTPKHDDTHGKGEMAAAAACYANPIRKYRDPRCTDVIGWPKGWGYKPKDRRSNLVRAAALLIAEIERLDRAVAA
jgi:hypothetical protein